MQKNPILQHVSCISWYSLVDLSVLSLETSSHGPRSVLSIVCEDKNQNVRAKVSKMTSARVHKWFTLNLWFSGKLVLHFSHSHILWPSQLRYRFWRALLPLKCNDPCTTGENTSVSGQTMFESCDYKMFTVKKDGIAFSPQRVGASSTSSTCVQYFWWWWWSWYLQ